MPSPNKKYKGEETHDYIVLKKFKTINTQPSRTALEEDQFAWIENYMPIGDAYAPAVPAPDTSIATLSHAASQMRQVTIGSTDYMFVFTAAGGALAVNLGTSATVTIAGTGTFTTASPGPAVDQWKSERAVICDPSAGYSSWDGTTFYAPGTLATISVVVGGSGFTSTPTVTFTGGGGTGATAVATLASSAVISITITAAGSGFTSNPTVGFTGGGGTGATASAYAMPVGQIGSAIASYSGRVWIANSRTLSYTAPGSWFDFDTALGAGSQTITEGFLRKQIYGLEALENYLYVFGDSSVFVLGDVKVTSGVTTYSFTNLSSTTGSVFKNSITSLERAILFMNRDGVYATYGASVQKVSQFLDGIFPNIDFTLPISAGLATIYNILCYVVSFTYNDPNQTNPRVIQACYFQGKWFITSQGELTFLAPAQISGEHLVYGTTGTNLQPLYTNTTAAIATTLQTALLPLDSPIIDKQVNRIGLEYTAPANTVITIKVDTENDSDTLVTTASNAVRWLNNSSLTVTWTNTAGTTIDWLTSGFVVHREYSDILGKYLGFTLTSNSPAVAINGMLAEYSPRASW